MCIYFLLAKPFMLYLTLEVSWWRRLSLPAFFLISSFLLPRLCFWELQLIDSRTVQEAVGTVTCIYCTSHLCSVDFLKHDKDYANPILQCVFYIKTLRPFKWHLITCLTDAFATQHALHLISSAALGKIHSRGVVLCPKPCRLHNFVRN